MNYLTTILEAIFFILVGDVYDESLMLGFFSVLAFAGFVAVIKYEKQLSAVLNNLFTPQGGVKKTAPLPWELPA